MKTSMRLRSSVHRCAGRVTTTTTTTTTTRAIVSDEVKAENAEQYAQLAQLLENYQYSYKVGDKVHGKVVACDQKGALVEIGAKADALVPTSECSLSAVKNVRVSCLMGFFITRRVIA